jgi:hypothetical protein
MSETAGEDGDAAQAFEALRAEVARLRESVELISRQGQAADYSLTLGIMAKALQAVQGRLAAIEAAPALALTPASYREQLDETAQFAGQIASQEIWKAVAAQNKASQAQETAMSELPGVVARARTAEAQRRRVVRVGLLGVAGGMVLWVLLAAGLTWGMGTWLAALPLAPGDRWAAGAMLRREEYPDAFDRMARLTNACGDRPVDLCVAALTLGTTAAPPARDSKPPAAGAAEPAPQKPGRR